MYPTLLEYAYMAAASYGNDIADVNLKFSQCPTHGNWVVRDYQVGHRHGGGNWGFQGVTFENAASNMVVCAYEGSKGGFFSRDKNSTAYDDWWVNDIQIARNQIPNQVPPAEYFAATAKHMAGTTKTFSLVGHSLGGGLAQFVGHKWNYKFVTFNAPGMAGNMPKRVFKTHAVKGFNMILSTDPVGNAGVHLGKTERFLNRGPGVAHKMNAVLGTLTNAHNNTWAGKTGDLLWHNV